MCNICFASKNGINFISTNTATLCPTHRQEWADEKNLGE